MEPKQIGLLVIVLCSAAKCDMEWKTILNQNALCNDFTPAGFFVDVFSNNNHKWVIFLESGGGCYSNTSCINRYFRDSFRSNPLYQGVDGHFNPSKAKSAKLEFDEIVSPLVTSMLTFSNTSYFPTASLRITGLGLLDRNCSLNPVYCTYNHVVIPYCSSDLWIADDASYPPNCNIPSSMYDACYNDTTGESCKQIGRMFYKECFLTNYSGLPFIYRGSVIFREAIKQLALNDSEEVILAGSSAGGVGAINQAKWLYNYLKVDGPNSNLSIIIDSAWFINFQDNIYTTFFGLVNQASVEENDRFLGILSNSEINATCNDFSYGSPCCISAYCMLTNSDYYPYTEVPTFAIISLYDVYLLGSTLSALPGVSQNTIQTSGFLPYLQVVEEYGGAMNTSISFTANRAGKFSYIVSECFQHIYFVTSTLWGEGRVLGTQSIEINENIGSFRHTMNPEVWRTMKLGGGVTISDALVMWNAGRFDLHQGLEIRDSCYSPHCNSKCPEQFIAYLGGDDWPSYTQVLLICIVIGVSVICLVLKAIFSIWLVILMKKQKEYQKTLSSDTEQNADDLREFPQCPESQTVSIACKNLSYSINLKPERIKDEKNDITHPVVLGGLDDREFSLSMSYRQSIRLDDQFNANVQKPRKPGTALPEEDNDKHAFCCKTFKHTNKKILRSVSTYFNAGELIGIMGPSGCGKTTLLDLLTGRRQPTEGQIFINGIPMNNIRHWYATHTGYVLQLAMPYYEKLTVRENLILTSQIKLSRSFTCLQKFERVEQVMSVTGLLPVADTVVGNVTGPGLSGGQKRRLTVAMQLLKLPSVIILDEPTSGLDSSSSFELLTHLNKLVDSNRTVIVTIHQPRLEIFHLFHRLVLLTDGKIAYHGVPDKAYEVFVTALKTRCLEQGYIIPDVEDHNPADVIMDMLGNPTVREIITEYYQHSGEQTRILELLNKAQLDSASRAVLQFVHEQKNKDDPRLLTRLATLEARNAQQGGIWQLLYLPCLFLAYGFLLGTAYWQTKLSFLVLSGFCVYSVASALFMFPALYAFYQKALEVYKYEHADAVCKPWDLVIQGFIKAVFMSIIPVIICAGILYVMLVDSKTYKWTVFGQLLVVNMALNQTWIALLIFLICTFPKSCARLSPVISSVAGFASGFFIPRDTMPIYYRWICYINPNYYGLFASAKLLLSDYNATCTDQTTVFQCFTTSGVYVLRQFNMEDTNPYLHVTILLCFTLFYLLAAVVSNAVSSSSLGALWPFCKRLNRNKGNGTELVQGNNLVIEMEPLNQEASAQGSLTARRRWKTAGKLCLEQIAQNRNASLDQVTFRSPFSDDSQNDTISSGLAAIGEPVPLKPKYLRTISKIQERQKRLARQVSTTVEFMKSIEESVVGKILQHPDNPRYTYYDAMKLYNDGTAPIETVIKHHRPPRRSTVGAVTNIRPVAFQKIREIASLRSHQNPQTPSEMGADTTATVMLEPTKYVLPTPEIRIEDTIL